jgi:hypothetical protein
MVVATECNRVTGFEDFVHLPVFQTTRQHNVSETGSVSVFRFEEGDTYSVGCLSKS